MIEPTEAVFAPTGKSSMFIGLVRARLLSHRTIKEVDTIHRQVLEQVVPARGRCGLCVLQQKYVRPLLVALEPYILDSGDLVDLPVGGCSSLMHVQPLVKHHSRSLQDSGGPLYEEAP